MRVVDIPLYSEDMMEGDKEAVRAVAAAAVGIGYENYDITVGPVQSQMRYMDMRMAKVTK